MSLTKLEQFQQALDERARQHLLRKPVCIEQYRGRLISIAGVQYLNFSSNDYLGLATEPLVLQAFADAALSYGAGSSGSPMLTGYHSVHQQLCDTLCDWLGLEQVLLFSSGFAANQAMLLGLCADNELLVLDKPLSDALRRNDTEEFARIAYSSENFSTLGTMALDYARQGITSLEEVNRVTKD